MATCGELLSAAEHRLVGSLSLRPMKLDPGLAEAQGLWRGSPASLVTHAYRGPRISYARFATLKSDGLEFGNVLCLPKSSFEVPILGADLVDLGRGTAMIAADLSPTTPATHLDTAFSERLQRAQDGLTPGGELPEWCRRCFSAVPLYTRFTMNQMPRAADALWAYVIAFTELLAVAKAAPRASDRVSEAQRVYCAAHLRDDKGLGLLKTMFGEPWAERYLCQVLFPGPQL
ncbi:MAG TPA: hypothetical protein VK009_13080 [Chloroflexota bacterium]|nr:hypothetical protein [Chloroflexota bacterium]